MLYGLFCCRMLRKTLSWFTWKVILMLLAAGSVHWQWRSCNNMVNHCLICLSLKFMGILQVNCGVCVVSRKLFCVLNFSQNCHCRGSNHLKKYFGRFWDQRCCKILYVREFLICFEEVLAILIIAFSYYHKVRSHFWFGLILLILTCNICPKILFDP